MSTEELYTKEARIWVPDEELVWKGAILQQDFKGQKELEVLYDEGEKGKVAIKNKEELPPLRNPEILIGENDLTSLSYLHEPAVLYNLQVRFCERNDIYTYCGIVLVAINPYQSLPIYDVDTIQAYQGQDMHALEPHVFAVAEEAFKNMSRFDENQSIIVSGESGAGKTVSAKYAMRYFATVGGAQAETQNEKKVVASNPIMEAIGNAKTTRNDNSSRFGKYIEIGFSRQDTIVGAHMRTYLLEKSRVVFQTTDERNYHIFYQLCSAVDLPEFESYHLDHPDIFFYTNQGEAPLIDAVDDAEEFLNTREAMSLLGFNEGKQMEIFRILSGILHMGNVVFAEDDKTADTCFIAKSDKHLPLMAELLGIDTEQIRMWLCNRKIVTAQEVVTKPLTVSQAYFSKDALAKHIYAELFNWIVHGINKGLTSTSKQGKFIGVLDIYGFETFETNSFEQFCINYANEKLQQQFCLHVFKLEQEEYVREQIEWSFIDFYDNQPCIDLIEGKLGILDMLDEECKLPRGSDQNWCHKLYEKHGKTKHFSKPRTSQTSFIIHHFADKVEYSMNGFLEKNRDTVLEEHINILKASQYELIAELFADKASGSAERPGQRPKGGVLRAAREIPGRNAAKAHRKTVGSQFRDSLNRLMTTLFSTTPHYVRCIKPNDYKLPFTFEPKRAVQQLRACGVLETIRISASGYPSRWTYQEFFQRYRVLAKSKQINWKDMKKTCANILTKLIEDRDKYQFGKTKIFFRAGQVAYLEKVRSERLRACGIMIQKHIRGWLAKRHYQKIQRSVRLVQTYGRGLLARRKALNLRRTHAATVIQTIWRGHLAREEYLRKLGAVRTIQRYARGMFGRHRFLKERCETKAMVIQRYVRGWLCRVRYQKMRRGFIRLQGHVRRKAAKRELKRLKIEARSVEHVKKVAKGLENKIIELQQKLDEKKHEVNVLREDQVALHNLRNEYEKVKQEAAKAKTGLSRLAELEALVKVLQAELSTERQEKADVITEKELIMQAKDEEIESLSDENLTLKQQLEEANKKIQSQGKSAEDLIQKKVAETKQLMVAEIESERSHHQKLVKDYGRLVQRFENLQGDMQLLSPTLPGHHRSLSGISNISLESESSVATERTDATGEKPEEGEDIDLGYGSGRRRKDEPRDAVNNLGWEKTQKELAESKRAALGPPEKIDLGILNRLQNRVKELEREKYRLQRELDHKDTLPDHGSHGVGGIESEKEIFDTIRMEKWSETKKEDLKMQELEMENSKLKEDIKKLRITISESAEFEGKGKGSPAAREFMAQFEAMADELERRREECIQLRTLLSARSHGMSLLAEESYGGDPNLVNEDGELEMAYKTQKDLNKLLETELQRVQKNSEVRERELRHQLDDLKADNDRQQKLIGQNLTMTPEAKIEATMQHEITRLTSENLDLRESIDKQNEQIKKLKKALKIYAKRLKSTEAGRAGRIDFPTLTSGRAGPARKQGRPERRDSSPGRISLASDVAAELEKEMAADENMPAVKHYREREYSGMFEYRKEDEPHLVRNLIIELKPRLAAKELPGLPAYILFMCIRHTDYMNDDEKVRTLLTNTINAIKKVVKKRQDDVETISLWLANTCRLLHNLKQYSGERAFQTENTSKQNEHCLRNFDLSEYRQILSDLAVWIYQGLIKLMESQIHPSIVGAVLEHEAIAGLSAGKPTGLRGRSQSRAEIDPSKQKDQSLDALIKSLNNFMRVLNMHAMDPELVKQVFRQLFYFICAHALNNLLLRKDMCHWTKGMQMRYNLSHLEQWMRDNKMQDCGAQPCLEPIIQASQLLQARKTNSDVDSICEMCSKLTTSQIIKILHLYTPVNEFEERVPISFIRKIQEKLQSRQDPTQTLLMDTKFFYAVTFPFNPSNLGLESIIAPQDWGLGFVKRL